MKNFSSMSGTILTSTRSMIHCLSEIHMYVGVLLQHFGKKTVLTLPTSVAVVDFHPFTAHDTAGDHGGGQG